MIISGPSCFFRAEGIFLLLIKYFHRIFIGKISGKLYSGKIFNRTFFCFSSRMKVKRTLFAYFLPEEFAGKNETGGIFAARKFSCSVFYFFTGSFSYSSGKNTPSCRSFSGQGKLKKYILTKAA